MNKYFIKQQDESDCGACSLLSIILFYKGYIPLEIIKIDTLTNVNGTNFLYIKKASEKYGFDVTGKYTYDLNNIKLPCIAHLNIEGYNHFVVIFNVDNKITYMDPSTGKVIMDKKDFVNIFTGNILEFIPKGKIIKYEKNKIFKNILKNIYLNNITSIILLFVLLILLIIFSLGANFNLILIKNNKLICLVFIILIIKVVINYLKNIIMSHLNKNINKSLLENYINHIFNLPLKYLQLKKPGDLINRINDLHNIKDFFSNVVIELFVNIIFFIGSLILLFILNSTLTLILLSLVLVYLVVIIYLNKDLYLKIINVIDSDNKFMDLVLEYLNKINTIKVLKSNYFINNINTNINNNLNNKLNLDLKINKIDLVKNSIEEIMLVLILIIHYKLNNDYMMMIIYISVYNYFIQSVKFFVNIIPNYFYFKDIYKRIKSIFDLENIKNNINRYNDGDIIVNNLSYSYNNINKIFNNFNLKIKKGEKVLLQGSNGSGKSTLLGLFVGLDDDYTGTIKISPNICYIEQNSQLFSDSILNNIILDKKYDKLKFKKIAKLTLLNEIIKNKPNGYNTNLNSIINLSGGEKQKIIIARGLYNDFNILIMDESLSEISKKIRKKLLLNIFKYYQNKTIIYVSHQDEKINFNQKIYLIARKDKYVNR
ncbi:MAG: cysteine peptidase family C39 domain-containing protein [Bacilli bacterium]|nr:cysteine peptidase family C39 domain-containing protein [Bacilli bacterium]MDD4406639.1 cysteine peptidase family C39 domain-containing protein [Bacilli bacterium]